MPPQRRDVAGQAVLAADSVRSREVVDALEPAKLFVALLAEVVGPKEVGQSGRGRADEARALECISDAIVLVHSGREFEANFI